MFSGNLNTIGKLKKSIVIRKEVDCPSILMH